MTTTYPYLKYYPLYARIWPRISGTLSILGSCYIAYDVIRKKKLAKTNHRILLGMSITDAVSSFCTVLGRLPAPKTAKYYTGLGTTATCTAQGFFYQTILSTVAYNAALAVYFLLVVKFQWKERDPNMKRVEWAFHAFAMLLFLGSGFALVAINLFNPGYFLCFIAEYPKGCYYKPDVPCTRGGNPDAYRWGFFYGPVWIMIFAVTAIMFTVYWTVLQQERKMDRFQFHASSIQTTRDTNMKESNQASQSPFTSGTRTPNSSSGIGSFMKRNRPRPQSVAVTTQRKHSKNVARQGMWYLVPFYLTWLFPMLVHALSSADVDGVDYLLLLKLTSIFMPLQGFMNMCVYLRPTMMKWLREKGQSDSYFSSLDRARKGRSSSNPSSGTMPTTTNIQSSIQSNRSSLGVQGGARGADLMSSFVRSFTTSTVWKSFSNNRNEVDQDGEESQNNVAVVVGSPSGDVAQRKPDLSVSFRHNNGGDSTVEMGLSFSDFDISFQEGCSNHNNSQHLVVSQREGPWLDHVMEESDHDDEVAATDFDMAMDAFISEDSCNGGRPKRVSTPSVVAEEVVAEECQQLDDTERISNVSTASNPLRKRSLSIPSLEILSSAQLKLSDLQAETPDDTSDSKNKIGAPITLQNETSSDSQMNPPDSTVPQMTNLPRRTASAPLPCMSIQVPLSPSNCEQGYREESSPAHQPLSLPTKSHERRESEPVAAALQDDSKVERHSSVAVQYTMNSPPRSNSAQTARSNHLCSTPSSVQSAPAEYRYELWEPDDPIVDLSTKYRRRSDSFEIV